MASVAEIKEKGIVGAGGAGFPAHVKLKAQAKTFIVNAAECEPLLHKDKELLQHKTSEFFAGLKAAMEITGAAEGIIGIKEKYESIIEDLKAKAPANVRVHPLRDYYPTGDELTLIYETTGIVIEAGKLPITQGIIVNNVETLINIVVNQPVITKFINVAGWVDKPVSLEVPIGTSFREIIESCSPKGSDFGLIVGGPMMGKRVTDLDEPVTKTTGGLIVLPTDHMLLEKYKITESEKAVRKIGKSACDQCTMCTEACPRFLLGHPIEPHMAMRGLVFSRETSSEKDPLSLHTMYCCECNLCSFIACPEDLFPSTICILEKHLAMSQKKQYEGKIRNTPHKMADFRRTPSKKLLSKLDLKRFNNTGPLVPFTVNVSSFKVLSKQHIGAPGTPVVKQGDRVSKGQKLFTVGENLGSEIHSPADGTVSTVTEEFIIITKN